MIGRIAQRFAKFFHRAIETHVEIDKGVRGPEALMKIVSRYDLTRVL
jgi:hypothetical protein